METQIVFYNGLY